MHKKSELSRRHFETEDEEYNKRQRLLADNKKRNSAAVFECVERCDSKELVVTLSPMEIRTFQIDVEDGAAGFVVSNDVAAEVL